MVRKIKTIEDNLIQSTLDSLSANIAILDNQGIIKHVNKAWRDFAFQNGLSADECCEGLNYLQVVENSNTKNGLQIIAGIKDVISRNREIFSFEYPCHSPEEKRWFKMKTTEIIEIIYQDFQNFRGDIPVQDDITYLMLKHNAKKK